MMTPLGWLLCTAGMAFLLVAALGVLRLPDALARQHAATKAGSVAAILFAAGTGFLAADSAWTWRLIALAALLLSTLPLASHALSRAAAKEGERR